MRHDESAPPVILSPHLDDAVLSAFTLLDNGAGALVVNLFDAVPPPGLAPAAVLLCGTDDAAGLMRRRHEEDREALARAGARGVSLGMVEECSRPAGEAPELAELVRAIDAAVPAARWLAAPLAIGRHPDHVLARDAAFALAARDGVPVRLYADLPYAITWGWPPWVSGEEPDPRLDPGVPWERALARLPAGTLVPEVTALDGARRSAKAHALAAYESQLSMLGGGPHRRLGEWALAFEVVWEVSPTTGSSAGGRPPDGP